LLSAIDFVLILLLYARLWHSTLPFQVEIYRFLKSMTNQLHLNIKTSPGITKTASFLKLDMELRIPYYLKLPQIAV
jgi:hypothetical protein